MIPFSLKLVKIDYAPCCGRQQTIINLIFTSYEQKNLNNGNGFNCY